MLWPKNLIKRGLGWKKNKAFWPNAHLLDIPNALLIIIIDYINFTIFRNLKNSVHQFLCKRFLYGLIKLSMFKLYWLIFQLILQVAPPLEQSITHT